MLKTLTSLKNSEVEVIMVGRHFKSSLQGLLCNKISFFVIILHLGFVHDPTFICIIGSICHSRGANAFQPMSGVSFHIIYCSAFPYIHMIMHHKMPIPNRVLSYSIYFTRLKKVTQNLQTDETNTDEVFTSYNITSDLKKNNHPLNFELHFGIMHAKMTSDWIKLHNAHQKRVDHDFSTNLPLPYLSHAKDTYSTHLNIKFNHSVSLSKEIIPED